MLDLDRKPTRLKVMQAVTWRHNQEGCSLARARSRTVRYAEPLNGNCQYFWKHCVPLNRNAHTLFNSERVSDFEYEVRTGIPINPRTNRPYE